MRKKTSNSVCPNCFKKKRLTAHHILPVRYFRRSDLKLYICRECHDELEVIISEEENGCKLNKNEYVQIAYLFIRKGG